MAWKTIKTLTVEETDYIRASMGLDRDGLRRSVGTVIPARHWRHSKTGATASVYGAHPGAGDPCWTIETVGYTIRWADGTVGCGRPPFATEAEAEAHLDAAVARRGRS